MPSMVQTAKDIIQSAAIIIGSTLAILTYFQARKTIFQPAKNEVFKIQISQLQKLLEDINWKSEFDAMQSSGIRESSAITIHNILNRYATERFGMKATYEGQPKSFSFFMSESSNYYLIDKGPADSLSKDEFDNWKCEKTEWESYTWDLFEISESLESTIHKISVAASNPIFPTNIIEKIENINIEITRTCTRIAEEQELAIRAFPRHYPSKESLLGADLRWVSNEISENGEGLFNSYLNLKNEVREYLKSDRLFERS